MAQPSDPKTVTAIRQIFETYKLEDLGVSVKKLSTGRVLCESTVTSPSDTEQEMKFFVAGLHKSNCNDSMPKMSAYEKWHTYSDPIKESTYDEKTKLLHLLVDGSMLPTTIVLDFQVPRITKQGSVDFIFPIERGGLFPGLKGQVMTYEANGRCLYMVKAHWRGTSTPYANFIVEIFTRAVNEYSLRELLRGTR